MTSIQGTHGARSLGIFAYIEGYWGTNTFLKPPPRVMFRYLLQLSWLLEENCSCIVKFRHAQILVARSPVRLNFVRWRQTLHNYSTFFPYVLKHVSVYTHRAETPDGLTLRLTGHSRIVAAQDEICIISPFWHLEFGGGVRFWEICGYLIKSFVPDFAKTQTMFEVLTAALKKIQVF